MAETKLEHLNNGTSDSSTPIDSNIEHPLMTEWTFWCDKTVRGATAEQYKDSLTEIHRVKTVEGFWRVNKHIPQVSTLATGVTYHLMRDTRLPMWEDKANCNGGTWRFRIHKRDSERVWQDTLLAAIGEQFKDAIHEDDLIVGVSLSIRDRDDLLQIWNDNNQLAQDSNTVIQMMKQMFTEEPVAFLASFYKPNQTHQAYEGNRTLNKRAAS